MNICRLKRFVKDECGGNEQILHQVISYIIEPDRLLFLVPPSVCTDIPRQVIMEQDEKITIKFVLNTSVKAVGVKIFDIEPDCKHKWKSAEIFGIPMQKSKETMKICDVYNLGDTDESTVDLNVHESTVSDEIVPNRTSTPGIGIPAKTEANYTNSYEQSLVERYGFHEHHSSDTSVGLFWKSLILKKNTLYCVRISLKAKAKDNVFVNKWYPNKFIEKPLYNYRYSLFRSLKYDVPATMKFVPNIAIMIEIC